jgi:crotonobetainyl-CoA:carnitine CoA-transferase CaiB-like acyl-CoA transferase
MPRLPLQFGSYDLKKRSDPPAKIGADTREIMTSVGYDDETIDSLASRDIVALGK